MVRWLHIGAGLVLISLLVAGCAVAPSGMTASPSTGDIAQELRVVRRDLGTLKRAQARHLAAKRRWRTADLGKAIMRLDRLNDRLTKQATERNVPSTTKAHADLAGEIAQLRGDVRQLHEEVRTWKSGRASDTSAPSKIEIDRIQQRRQHDKILAAVTRLTEAVDRNNAQLKALTSRVANTDQKVSALQQQLTSRRPGNQDGQVPPNASQGNQSVTNTLGSVNKLCSAECAAGGSTSPTCHRCTSCAEQCVRREGASPAALNACRNYCATR